MKAIAFALIIIGSAFLFIQKSRAQAISDPPKLVLFIDGKPFVGDSIPLSTILQADSLSTNKSWIMIEKATITFYGPGVCIGGQGVYTLPLPKGQLTSAVKKMILQLKGNYYVGFECEQAVRIFGDKISVQLLSMKILASSK